MPESRHIGVWIDRPAEQVYEYAADPANLTHWASGVGALGDITIEFATVNDFGVLDHLVTLPTGETFYNPMRVIPAGLGESRCEVVFTLRRGDSVSDAQFEADAAAIIADLHTLRALLQP